MRALKLVLLVVMGLFYVVAGVNHFVNPAFYVNIMPPSTRVLAAWGIIALLISVFPANLHVALHDVPMVGAERGAGWLNWARLPLQGVLIAWAWWYTRAPEEVPS